MHVFIIHIFVAVWYLYRHDLQHCLYDCRHFGIGALFMWSSHFFHLHIFEQICRLWDRVLSTTRGSLFNTESASLPRACVPHPGGFVDIKDLPHWWEKEAREPEPAAENAVSEKWTETHNTQDLAEMKRQGAKFCSALYVRARNAPVLTCIVPQVTFSVRDSHGFFSHSLTETPKLTLSLRVRHSAAACSSLQMSQPPPLLCIFCTSYWGKRPLCLQSRKCRSPLLPHHHRECIRQVHIAIWWSASLILCAKY